MSKDFHPTPVWVAGEARLEMCIHYRSIHPLPSLLDIGERSADEVLFGGGYLRFCIVRNPYWRLLSSWNSKIRQADLLFASVNIEIQKFLGREATGGYPTFREFANWVTATNDPHSCNVHWRSQERLLSPEVIPYDAVLKTERLGPRLVTEFSRVESLRAFDIEALLKQYDYNESLPLVGDPPYDEALAAQIYEFYREDFQTYGYSQDSWKEPRAGNASVERVEAVALDQIRRSNQLIGTIWTRATESSERLAQAAWEAKALLAEIDAASGGSLSEGAKARAAQEQTSSLQGPLAHFDRDSGLLLETVKIAREETRSHRSERDTLQAERDALQAERAALRVEHDGLQAERDALHAETNALHAETDALRARIKQVPGVVRSFFKRVQRLRRSIRRRLAGSGRPDGGLPRQSNSATR